jgi:hypothetical protein
MYQGNKQMLSDLREKRLLKSSFATAVLHVLYTGYLKLLLLLPLHIAAELPSTFQCSGGSSSSNN